jgi:hypothetical protein
MTSLLAVSCWLEAAAGAPADPRTEVLLNQDWAFTLADPETMESAESAPAEWTEVDLPHTWNVADSRDEKTAYHRGTGRYRKSVLIEPELAGKRLYLHFEGANQVADVTVNGRSAGRHVGGYTAFAFDVTDLVRIGEANEIEVWVDNRHDDDIPPLNADFTFYGGIYRDVRLLALDRVHFLLDKGSGAGLPASQFMVAGTIIATPTTQISRPTKNSTGRRSTMPTHQQTGWLLAAETTGSGTGKRRRAGMRPRRCGVNGARYRRATSRGEPVEPRPDLA